MIIKGRVALQDIFPQDRGHHVISGLSASTIDILGNSYDPTDISYDHQGERRFLRHLNARKGSVGHVSALSSLLGEPTSKATATTLRMQINMIRGRGAFETSQRLSIYRIAPFHLGYLLVYHVCYCRCCYTSCTLTQGGTKQPYRELGAGSVMGTLSSVRCPVLPGSAVREA
jgi:hypothetical protein